MLAQSSDYGYGSLGGGYAQQQNAQQGSQQSHERPKFLTLDNSVLQQHNGYAAAMPGYPHQIMHQGTPQHHMTPQHHQQHQYDHEPLMMGMHGANQYYQPLGTQVLQISADYHQQHHHNAATPASSEHSGGNAGSKRSREELNLKEKKRMFKLNDRINQLKTVLDEAGVQTKKNKQSILDNTYHYIGMLRSNLLIAKQKAERAEKQAETFRAQAQRMSSGAAAGDAVFKRCFDQSSTPRIIVDSSMSLVAVNNAFLAHSGESEESLSDIQNVRSSICLDENKLHSIMSSVTSSMKPLSSVVQARGANGTVMVTLLSSIITDEVSGATTIEFSLIPFESSSEYAPQSSSGLANISTTTPLPPSSFLKTEASESSPSGVSDLGV